MRRHGRSLARRARSARGDLRWRRRALDLRLERGKLGVHLGVSPRLVEFLLDLVAIRTADILEHAGLQQFVHGLGMCLHGGDLVLGTRDVRAGAAEALGDARGTLADRAFRLRRGVLGLQHLLLSAEVVHPLLQRRQRVLQLLLLRAELLALRLQGVDLGLGGGLARQRLPRQLLLALAERSLRLVGEVVHGALELLLLQFDLLAGPGDGHQSPLDLSDLVEHLLVGQVENLVRPLRGVERLVGLGLEYVVRPLEETHADVLLVMKGRSQPGSAAAPPPGRSPAAMAGPDTRRLPPRTRWQPRRTRRGWRATARSARSTWCSGCSPSPGGSRRPRSARGACRWRTSGRR